MLKDKVIILKVSEEDKAKFSKAANKEGFSLSAFLRRAAGALADKVLGKGGK